MVDVLSHQKWVKKRLIHVTAVTCRIFEGSRRTVIASATTHTLPLPQSRDVQALPRMSPYPFNLLCAYVSIAAGNTARLYNAQSRSAAYIYSPPLRLSLSYS